MVRDPARFLREPNYEKPLTDLFGGEQWRDCEDASDRAECLMHRFKQVVEPDIALHALPFKVYEDARQTVLYYPERSAASAWREHYGWECWFRVKGAAAVALERLEHRSLAGEKQRAPTSPETAPA